MKQTNKLLNIANILNYVFCLCMGLFVIDIFERYALLFATTVVSITGISNLIIGIINIVKGNKKIGIFNIIISAMFIFDAIMFPLMDDLDDWMFFAILVCVIVPVILTILNLVFNRKVNDLNKTKKKSIVFLLGIIVEVIIIVIPIIVNRINLNNIEKAIHVLENDSSERIVLHTYDEIKICDLEGNIIHNLKYDLIKTFDIESSRKKANNNSNHEISVMMVKTNNQLWLVDYNGNLIERLYCLFEKKLNISGSYRRQIGKIGYRDISGDLEGITNSLSLNYHQDNIYKFGSIEENGYQIIVEINENELESDTELFEKIEATYYNNSIYNDYLYNNEDLRKIKNIYKYKKNYSIVTKSGEVKKIDCNNLIFSMNSSDELEIKQYSNNYIPYFDKDSSGFINVNGEKIGFKKDYIVIDTINKYAIVYNLQNNNHYIYIIDNNKVIDLGNYGLRYYDNNYIISGNKFLIFKDNKTINLLDNNDTLYDHIFINYDKKNKRYVSPYNDIDIYYDELDEITESNLVYNE